MGCFYTYCIRCSSVEESWVGDLSFLGDPSRQPLDRLKIQNLAIFAEPLTGARVSPSHKYPPRDGANACLPMQCVVYTCRCTGQDRRGSFFDSGTGTDRSLTPACDSYSPDSLSSPLSLSVSLHVCLSVCPSVVALRLRPCLLALSLYPPDPIHPLPSHAALVRVDDSVMS